jgi:hypothetical protein
MYLQKEEFEIVRMKDFQQSDIFELLMEKFEALALLSFCAAQKEMRAKVEIENTSLFPKHHHAVIFTCADVATASKLEQWLQTSHQKAYLYLLMNMLQGLGLKN